MKHQPVLLEEALSSLNLKETSLVVDATLGYGGHSSHILQRIKKGFLFAFDQDGEAIRHSANRLTEIGTNFTIIKSNFCNMQEKLKEHQIEKVDAILFDLGVSSPQLDEQERGFSYHLDAPLDMRMDQENPLTAQQIVNEYSKEQLIKIFKEYGEAEFANNIAKHIVEKRKTAPIETTLQLVEIIKEAVPLKKRLKKHPAKQIFQALRIEVNKELEVLEQALTQALELVNVGGRVAVITFHSLEDRIVKNYFKEVTEIDEKVKGLPEIPEKYQKDFRLITKKPVVASLEEVKRNPRAHSAKLRVIERIK